jgi:sodium-coupled neutral amino acid transporter 11
VHATSLCCSPSTMTHARNNGSPNPHGEDRGLLSHGPDYDDDYFGLGVDDHSGSGSGSASADLGKASGGKTDSNGQPRTPGRVRFDLTPEIVPVSNGQSFGGFRDDDGSERRSSDDAYFDIEEATSPARAHRTPLLTDMEAPSVTLANSMGDPSEQAEHEMNRPKSGLKSAFMNMANSIIGAGIIGQPYAVRQAGLVGGILLLVGLTVVVDWTICLIVINSKLSGTSHFQGTVEHCFGQSGLIAISVAQWVFAFGGMVAYGVIVGDTIPHVLVAVWPNLAEVPVIGLLANRQVAIAVFVMGIGYPLTLYRDISKVRVPQADTHVL